MKNIFRTSFGISLFCVLANFGYTQNPSTPVPKALSDILRLEGSWQGEATMTLEGKTYTFTYYADFRKTADGSGLTMNEWFTHPDLGTLKGSNLIGYNANDQMIHWFSVDNFGTAHDHLGKWTSADHFTMQANEVQQGKKLNEKIDMVFTGNNQLELVLVARLNDEVFQKANVTFHRAEK